ncbi:hypothetical protein BDR05DRAFT_427512 [Suillus weaverae]|nr:hypothetical protein BDR05DRAFT_427512 [Suillus weaverae]
MEFGRASRIESPYHFVNQETACQVHELLKTSGLSRSYNMQRTFIVECNHLKIQRVAPRLQSLAFDEGGRNAIQMTSYMSLVTSMGNMIVGLLIVLHNCSKGQGAQSHADFTIENTALKSWASFIAC